MIIHQVCSLVFVVCYGEETVTGSDVCFVCSSNSHHMLTVPGIPSLAVHLKNFVVYIQNYIETETVDLRTAVELKNTVLICSRGPRHSSGG
jgi:hypothetical protein